MTLQHCPFRPSKTWQARLLEAVKLAWTNYRLRRAESRQSDRPVDVDIEERGWVERRAKEQV